MQTAVAGGATVATRGGPAPGRNGARAPARRGRGGGANLGEVARGGTQNLVGAVVAAVATSATTVLVTRNFTKGEAGAFFTAISAFLIVETLATLGANVGLVYFIARLRSLREEARIPMIMRAAVVPVLVASFVLTAAMFAFTGPLAHLIIAARPGGHVTVGSAADALRGLAVTIPFAAQIDTVLGATRGYRDMTATVWVDRIGTTVGQLLGVAVAVGLGSAALLAPLWAVPYVPLSVVAWVWLRRIRRRAGARGAVMPAVPPELAALMALAERQTSSAAQKLSGGARSARRQRGQRALANANARGFWRFTGPRGVAMVTSALLQRLDIVIVAILIGPAQAAVYTAATRFLVLSQFGSAAVSRASQPRLTELIAVKDMRGTSVVYQGTTAWLVLLNWPIYLLVLVFGSQALGLFGHSYKAGYSVMVVLCIATLAGTLMGQVDMMLVTAGKSSWSMWNGLLQLGTNVGLDLWLIPRHGILGAAIAWAVAITIGNVVPLIQLALVTKLHPFSRGSLIAVVLCVACFAVVPVAIKMALGPTLLAFVAGSVAGTVLFIPGMARFRRALKLGGMPGTAMMERYLTKVKRRFPGGR
jgi:O-antigen/teichoic acid export membrane protein